MKQISDIRNMSNDQLQNRLNDIEISLRRQRSYNLVGIPGPNNNSMYIGNLRKEKARILTVLNKREANRNVDAKKEA